MALGRIYEQGLGIAKGPDLAKAIEYYDAAAEIGNEPYALYWLGK